MMPMASDLSGERAFTADQLAWVHGLRPGLSGVEWRGAVAAIILGQLNALPAGQKTLEAEAGLGLEPSWYWYVARAETAFGHGVFFWRAQDQGWPDGARGVCPFDTGGLWHGHVRTAPVTLTPQARRAFVATSGHVLEAWTRTVSDALRRHYAPVAEYVSGAPPNPGVDGILGPPDNDSRAWVWEARVARDNVVDNVVVTRLYWSDEDRLDFLNWLEDSPFGLSDAKRLASWVETQTKACAVGQGAAHAAEQDLLGRLAPGTP